MCVCVCVCVCVCIKVMANNKKICLGNNFCIIFACFFALKLMNMIGAKNWNSDKACLSHTFVTVILTHHFTSNNPTNPSWG